MFIGKEEGAVHLKPLRIVDVQFKVIHLVN